MKIRKLLSASIVSALLITALAGCSGGSTAPAGTAAAAGGEAESGTGLRTIRVAFMTGQPDHYAAVIGQEEGFYEKHGLKVEGSEYAYGINTIDAIANGTADVGQCADFAGINRIGNTLDYNKLVFYAELSASTATTGGVYVAPEFADDITKLNDSKGWITSIGTRTEYDNYIAQQALGLDPDKQKQVNTDSAQTQLAAATNGDASAVVSSGTQAAKFEELGWVKVATSADIDSSVGAYLVTSKPYIEANADILADYLAALDESVKYINEHLDEVAVRLSEKFGVEPENFKTDWKTPNIIIGFTEDGAKNLERIEEWASTHGRFEKAYNVRDFIVTDAVKKAFPDRVTMVQ